MFCLACMNIDGAETLILAEFMVLVTFLKSLLPAGMGGCCVEPRFSHVRIYFMGTHILRRQPHLLSLCPVHTFVFDYLLKRR